MTNIYLIPIFLAIVKASKGQEGPSALFIVETVGLAQSWFTLGAPKIFVE